MDSKDFTDIDNLKNNVSKIERKWNERNAVSINVIECVAHGGKIREEAHSRILSCVLKCPNAQVSFIKKFLNIDVEAPLCVKTEEGKVDVKLFSPNKDIVILVENKINDAPEMASQVARYVQDARKGGYKSIYMIYLNPDHHYIPSVHSLELDGKNIFDEMPEENFKALSYKDDITNWLKEIEKSTTDIRLKSALIQYVDYLEVMFDNTDKEREIRKEIDMALHIEDFKAIEKFNILKDKLKTDEEKLLPYINRYMKALSTQIVYEWLNEVRRTKPTINLNTDEAPTFEFQLNCGTWFAVCNHRYNDFTPSWMFWENDNKKLSENKVICEEIIKKVGVDLDTDAYQGNAANELLHGRTSCGAELFKKVYDAARDLKYID